MLTFFADWYRLAGAAYRLTRFDALIPSEYAHLLPAPLRAIGSATRIGARRTENGRALRPGERLAAAFEGMGPAYVKLGQLMATRPDIIGFEMAKDLSRLQDKMPPFPRDEAAKELEKTFGKPISDLFTEFPEPIAAASIAQVHKALLKDGTPVAVKVLRPAIEQTAAQEFRAFARAARQIERIGGAAKRLEPVQFIETLRTAAAVELDLRMEAGAASVMEESLKEKGDVRVPKIIWPLSGRRILTLEWVDGIPVNDLEALEKAGVDRKALAVQIMQVFLTQALHEGFFHADMHQGNLLVDRKGRLVLIDFGIMGRLDDMTRHTFAQILHGFITRDYRRTAQVHFDAGYIDPSYPVDAFAQALRAVGEPLYGQNADAVDMSRVLQQLFDVTDLFDMHLRPELLLLQRTMVAVEGVARMLHPSINMWDTARPVVRAYVENEIGPQKQLEKLRDAAAKAAEIAPHLPDYLTTIARASERLADARDITLTKELSSANKNTARALWFAGLSAIILAAAIILS